jgi:sensor histidine kinase YesM
MIEYIFLIAVTFVEMLISYIVFSHLADLKRPLWTCFLAGAFIFESAVAVNVFLSNNIWVNGIYFAIINIAFALLFFYISPVKAIFYSVLLDIFSTALEFATIFLFSMIFKVDIREYNSSISILIIEGTISKAAFFIVCLLLIRFIHKESVKSKFPKSFYIYPASTMIALLAFWKICIDDTLSPVSQILFSVISLLLFIATVVLFITYQHHIEKESTLIAMQGELSRLKTEKSYYDILEHQDEQLLAYAHDTKNHLSAIKNLNDNPQIDAYLDEMAENLKKYRNVCRSGNITLDVIINKYITECKIKGVDFTHDVRVSNLNCIDDFDLVTILGNLLDNAIEAAEKSAQKSISIETDCRNNYSIIIVSNSCDSAPKSRGDKLLTTKTDSSVHGIGVKNVAKAVKKYDGDLSWEYDIINSTFKVTIMMKY